MKKKTAIITICLLMVLFVGCVNKSEYTTSDKLFYVKVTDGFTKMDNSYKANVLFLQDLQNEEDKFQETIKVIVDDSREALSLEDYYKLDLKDEKNFLADYEEQNKVTIKIGEVDTYKVNYKASVLKKTYEFEKYIMKYNKKFYILVFQFEESNKETFRETIDKIVQTVEFK